MQKRFLPLVVAAFVFSPFFTSLGFGEDGKAAWYSDHLHGRKTASGEVYDKTKLTAAHHNLAFGTEVKVTIVDSEKSVVVKINDRCKMHKGRIIDLSRAAAEEIGLVKLGVADVTLEILKKPDDS
ncbi:MAG: septal ring lytic transglycosylase RlpA family protein [Verrucomicrobiota bacterium]